VTVLTASVCREDAWCIYLAAGRSTMHRRLAVFVAAAGLVVGAMASISLPAGTAGGAAAVRSPILIIHDAADLIVRTLFGTRGRPTPTVPTTPIKTVETTDPSIQMERV
jgi:hypothetical protein